MSSQQWGGQSYGRPGPQSWPQQGYPPGGFPQPSYGPPQYQRAPAPGYAPQGGQGPGPRRRRNPLKVLLLALIVVAGLAVVGLVATGIGTSDSSDDVAYQNSDYQVPPPDLNPPPIVVPDTYDQAEAYITQNAFYGQTVPAPVECGAKPITNVSQATDDQLEAHLTDSMACLVRVWEPPVTAAGFVIVRPSVTIYGEKTTTKCGSSGVNAFYCAADQQVYYSDRLAEEVPFIAQNKWGTDVVIAHEFGHALQARTGILVSSKALGQNAGNDAEELQLNRRLEQQADCFSGMYLRSVSVSLGIQQSDLEGIQATYRAVGDDTLSGKKGIVGDHGRAASRVFWGTTGLSTSDISKCNTYVAPASEVR